MSAFASSLTNQSSSIQTNQDSAVWTNQTEDLEASFS